MTDASLPRPRIALRWRWRWLGEIGALAAACAALVALYFLNRWISQFPIVDLRL